MTVPSKIIVGTIDVLLVGVLAAAQARPSEAEGTWTGDVACLHGGGDQVAITITREARGRLVGTSDWGLARSDGRKGPQVPFETLTVNGSSITATGEANGHVATLHATVERDAIRGSWRVAGVEDEWTFVAKKVGRPLGR
jgi:hypothetical protein